MLCKHCINRHVRKSDTSATLPFFGQGLSTPNPDQQGVQGDRPRAGGMGERARPSPMINDNPRQ